MVVHGPVTTLTKTRSSLTVLTRILMLLCRRAGELITETWNTSAYSEGDNHHNKLPENVSLAQSISKTFYPCYLRLIQKINWNKKTVSKIIEKMPRKKSRCLLSWKNWRKVSKPSGVWQNKFCSQLVCIILFQWETNFFLTKTFKSVDDVHVVEAVFENHGS